MGWHAGTEAPVAVEGGLVEREAAKALAALEALARCAHIGRGRPELAHRLAIALALIDDALAGAARELYENAAEPEE